MLQLFVEDFVLGSWGLILLGKRQHLVSQTTQPKVINSQTQELDVEVGCAVHPGHGGPVSHVDCATGQQTANPPASRLLPHLLVQAVYMVEET